MKKTSLLILAAIAALSAGCVQTSVKTAGGDEFKRISFLNKQSVGKVTFNAKTGDFAIEGYSSDQAETAGAVVKAAVEARLNPIK